MSTRRRPVYRWRCHTCGELSSSWAAAQRHADSHGGGRIDCTGGEVVPGAAVPNPGRQVAATPGDEPRP